MQITPLNYLLAGLIVERASGVPLSDYLEQHIFIPLVMDHTFLAGDSGISPTHATGYTRTAQGFVTAPMWDPSWLAGDAGFVSTIDDLAKWDIEMPVLLRVDAVRTIFTPGASVGPTQYGMGWVIDRRGGKEFVWSNGEISGYRAMNALLPERPRWRHRFFERRFVPRRRHDSRRRSEIASSTCSCRRRRRYSTMRSSRERRNGSRGSHPAASIARSSRRPLALTSPTISSRARILPRWDA